MAGLNPSDKTDASSSGRRTFLKTAGVAATGLLAGCTGGGGSTPTPRVETRIVREEGGTVVRTVRVTAESFPSEDITWIVPYSPGGGFDTYSRGLAEFMPPHLPNDVDIIVQNRPGAGGRTGATEVYRSDPDGYTIGIWNMPGMVASQIVLDTTYDVSQVSWIGRVARSIYMMAVPADGDYQSLEEMQNASEPVKFAVTGPGSTSFLSVIIATSVMGIETEFVTGYSGSQESVAAALRGDVDAVQYPFPSPSIKSPVEDGDMTPIIVYDRSPPPYAPDTLTADDAGYESLIGQVNLQRLVGGPPGIPAERVSILEGALLGTLNSGAFANWADEQGRPIDPAGSRETAEAVAQAQETFAQYRDLIESEYVE